MDSEMTAQNDIITAPIPEFCRISGLGQTKVYALLNDGQIESITIESAAWWCSKAGGS